MASEIPEPRLSLEESLGLRWAERLERISDTLTFTMLVERIVSGFGQGGPYSTQLGRTHALPTNLIDLKFKLQAARLFIVRNSTL